jgi:Sec-independent protein translocase protein TatA
MPQIGRSIGRAMGEFRRASNDFKRTIEEEVAAEDIRGVERDLKQTVADGRAALSGGEVASQSKASPTEEES